MIINILDVNKSCCFTKKDGQAKKLNLSRAVSKLSLVTLIAFVFGQMVLLSSGMGNPDSSTIDGRYDQRGPMLEEKSTPDYGAFQVQGTLRAETYKIAGDRPNGRIRRPSQSPIFNKLGTKNEKTLKTYLYNGDFVPSDELEAVGKVNGCTGTLITDDLVLTAAHCVGSNKRATFILKNVHPVDDPDTNSDESITRKDVRINGDVRVHPEYGLGRKYNYDLAVIKLDRPINKVALVEPIAIEKPNNIPEYYEMLTLVGFGNTGGDCSNKSVGEQSKLRVKLPAFVSSRTELRFRSLSEYSCYGDSGGPVLNSAGHAVGVLSTGNLKSDSTAIPTWRSYNWILSVTEYSIVSFSIKPKNPHEGDTITMNVRLKNIGETVPEFKILVKINQPDPAPPDFRRENTYVLEQGGRLYPGQTGIYVSPLFVAHYPGWYRIQVEVVSMSGEVISVLNSPWKIAVRCQESCL